jgi:hypothetical protein
MLWNRYRKNRDSDVMAKGRRSLSEEEIDRPLNYYSDQVSNIRGQLRNLKIDKGVNTTVPYMLLTGAAAMLLRRRYLFGALFLGGFLLNAYRVGRRLPELEAKSVRDPLNTDVEQYALKAERGDYGHLEVIPFK